MTGLIKKTRDITLGNLHNLLDKMIDLDSAAVSKQHVRDLEEAVDGVRVDAAAKRGRVSQAQAAVTAVQAQILQDTEHAQLLLDDDIEENDADAQRLMEGVVELEEQLKERQKEHEEAQEVAAALAAASQKLTSRLVEMRRNVRRLEDLERSTKAKEQSIAALEAASKATGSIDSVSIDSAEQRLRDRGAVADERLKDAMSGVSGGSVQESVTAALARKKIAEMRAKKAAASGGAAGG